MASSIVTGTENITAFVDLPVDDADVLLIAQVVLRDVEEHQNLRKGKARDGSPFPDEDIAFDLLASDALSVLSVIRDGVFARSIDNALTADQDLLRQLYDIEVTAQIDREMALAVSRSDSQASVRSTTDDNPFAEGSNQSPSSASSVYLTADERVDATTIEPISRVPALKLVNRQECTICGDVIHGVVVAVPCGHFYDLRCALRLFDFSTRDESLYPPSCCRQRIPLELMKAHLSSTFIKLFEEKGVEFTTTNRLYCASPSCSRFLGSGSEDAITIPCPTCYEDTCAACKEPAHPAHIPCATDEGAQATLALARDSGWQQCLSCNNMVELTIGCYHITCRCSHQFCYLCRVEWKNCGCLLWNEDRLLLAAQERVERERLNAEVEVLEEEVPQMVDAMLERLLEAHDCPNHTWQYRSGGGRCDTCANDLPYYLLRCTRCEMLACVPCQRNRL